MALRSDPSWPFRAARQRAPRLALAVVEIVAYGAPDDSLLPCPRRTPKAMIVGKRAAPLQSRAPIQSSDFAYEKSFPAG
jgi:hypothetical protein